jgi:hypothetical protein
MKFDHDLQVLHLLNSRRGQWQMVARASGVSYSWLSKFACGRINNPGYSTLKKMHASLTGDAIPANRPAETAQA